MRGCVWHGGLVGGGGEWIARALEQLSGTGRAEAGPLCQWVLGHIDNSEVYPSIGISLSYLQFKIVDFITVSIVDITIQHGPYYGFSL